MAFDDLAQKLFGARRAESNAVLTDATTGTIHGTALTDSADGAVTIEIDGDVTVPEEIEVDGEVYYGGSGVGIEVPTSENVKAGDEVLVSVYGEGTMRSPAVTSAIGSGDRIAADASAAREIAEATGQHFWDADDGAHVTEVTREEWEQQQTGPNSLWNSLGMLFRNGLTNLLAIIAGTARSETFTIARRIPSYSLAAIASPRSIEVTIGGVSYSGFYVSSGVSSSAVVLPMDDRVTYEGQEMVVTYKSAPSLEFFDGEGNADANIVAEFSQNGAALCNNYAEGDAASAGLSFFKEAASIGVSRDTSKQGTAYQTIRMGGDVVRDGVGESLANIYIDQNIDSSSNNVSVMMKAVVNSGRYYYPQLGITVDSTVDSPTIYARSTKVTLEVPSHNPTTPTTFTMQHVIDMLTTSSTALTRSSATSSWTSGEVKRSGKVVTVTVVGAKLASALASGSNSAAITTIPYGFRPTMLQRVPCALSANGNYANVWAAIGTGGAIVIGNHSAISIPNTSEISLNCTYIID